MFVAFDQGCVQKDLAMPPSPHRDAHVIFSPLVDLHFVHRLWFLINWGVAIGRIYRIHPYKDRWEFFTWYFPPRYSFFT